MVNVGSAAPIVAVVCILVAGCKPPVAGTVSIPVDDKTVVDAGTHLIEMTAHQDQMTAILKQVSDETSARKALAEIKRLNESNLAGVRYARALQLGKVSGTDYPAQEAKWLAALAAFKAELDRLKAQDPAAYRVLIALFIEE